MIEKLKKKGERKQKPISIALDPVTMQRVKSLALKHNTTMREIIRYLVDLAYEEKIKLE